MLLLYFYLLTLVFVGVHVAFVFLSIDVFICVGCVWCGCYSSEESLVVIASLVLSFSLTSLGELPPSAFVIVFVCVCVFVFVFVFVTILHCVSPPPPCSAAST